MAIFDRINSPADLKNLSREDLEKLSAELRDVLVGTVTDNGGHLASNLGVVELTIALHRIFDSPTDKIIWDVGHQSYVHKLLTGRKDRFNTLRQFGGLSGFTNRNESEHDPFGAGHASTSVSAALGIAAARDLAHDDYHVIAVIGDGAMGGGMALEAITHAGHLGSRLIVILNDNGMSISPTVGALSRILNRIRFDQRYHRAKASGLRILNKAPLGKPVTRMIQFTKSRFKKLVMPTMLWEEFGFSYVGPVDGHNFESLEEALKQAKSNAKPTLVHVITTKGNGYQPAECEPVNFHGLSSKKSSKAVAPSYSDVFAQTMVEIAKIEPRLVVITAAMPEGNCLGVFRDQFPDRLFDVGICEQHAVTFAAGLATKGYIPVVAVYSTFLQRAFDQIIHDVCAQDLHVVFALDRGGIVGDDGRTHQGIFDLSYLSVIPNLVVSAPKDENELRHLLFTAVKSDQAMAVRYPRMAGLGVSLDPELKTIPIGSSELLRVGSDVVLIPVGNMVAPAMEAAGRLAAKGIEASVINTRWVKPLDRELITSLAGQTGHVVTIEENTLVGGLGSSVARLLQESGLSGVQLKTIGIPDQFVDAGSQPILRAMYGLDAEGIVSKVESMFPGRVSVTNDSITITGPQ